MSAKDVPVLLITYKRLDTALKVVDTIRSVGSRRVYLFSDGVMEDKKSDYELVNNVRNTVLQAIDWDCDIKTFFSDENLGCGLGPKHAISWMFDSEPYGIILEDDIIVSEDFFRLCFELLEKYKDDERVMSISSMNFQDGWINDETADYYFSDISTTWGWASWKRAWDFYDYNASNYEKLKKINILKEFIWNRVRTHHVISQLEHSHLKNPRADWWDVQWMFSVFENHGLSIVPNKNLGSNIGFNEQGTHTLDSNSIYSNRAIEDLQFPLRHPTYMIPDVRADERYIKRYHKITVQILLRYVMSKFKRWLVSIIK